MHDIQHRDYDESADNVDMETDASEQRKTFEEIEAQTDDVPVTTNSSTSDQQPTNNDAQALNLTTATTGNVRFELKPVFKKQSTAIEMC